MAEKPIDERIADKEAELEVLKAEKARGSVSQEYPKMIQGDDDPETRLVVHSKEEESRHQGEVVKAFDLTPEEQEAKRVAQAEADKEAARAKSRLSGPASAPPKETKAAKVARVKSEKSSAKAAKKAAPAKKPGVLVRAKAKLGRHK